VFFLFCMTLLGCSVVVTPPPEETEETEPEPQPQRFEVRAKALPRDLAVPGQVKAFGLYEVENTTTVEVCVTSIELARVGALNGIVTAAATFSTGKGGPAQHALDGTSAQIDVEGDGCVPSGESKTFSVTGTVGQIDPGTGSVQSGDTIGILLTNVTASASEDVEVTLLDGQDVEVASLSGVQHVLRRARPVVSVYPVDSTVVDGEFEAYRFAISADSVGGPVGLASFALEMPSAAVDGMPTRLRRYDATVQQDVDMSATMTVLADTPQAGTSTVLVRFGELVLNPDPNESTILSLRWSYLGEIAAFALAFLRERSPVRSGAYRAGFYLGIDGRFVTADRFDPARMGEASEVVIGNVEPYSRKVDVQATGGQRIRFSVPPNLFDDAAKADFARKGVFVFDTYVGAATEAYKSGLISKDNLQRVAAGAERELAAIHFSSPEQKAAREADLARDLAAMRAVL
jgi:hypothetical protein